MYTRIKQVLDYSGLNQQEFAERIAVAPATLSNILKGKTAKYNIDLLMSIRTCFPAINFEWLLTGDGSMLNDDPSSTIPLPTGVDSTTGKTPSFQEGLFVNLPDGDAPSEAGATPAMSGAGQSRPTTQSPSSAMGTPLSSPYSSAANRPTAMQSSAQNPAEGVRNFQDNYLASTTGYPSASSTGMNPSMNGAGTRNTSRTLNRQVSYFPEGYSPVTPAEMAMKYTDNYRRSIKEIRVFFDDDTFEVFVPLRSDSKIK